MICVAICPGSSHNLTGLEGGTKSCVFCSNRIRTLVAMAAYSSHRLIMEKEEIDNIFCLIGDILNFFLQKCLLSSPLRFV